MATPNSQYFLFICLFIYLEGFERIENCSACCGLSAAMSVFLPVHRYNQVNALQVACSTDARDCRTLTSTWYSQWMAKPHENM